jgi:hypothetical protein
MWPGIHAWLMSAGVAAVGEHVFTRGRPSTGDNPCLAFQGGSNYSFPSGEASIAAALATPDMLEYGGEHPAAYLLALLPLYVGEGWIKNQAHWQTDVLAGWAIGGVSGWYAHGREVPLMIEVLPGGVAVGIRKRFGAQARRAIVSRNHGTCAEPRVQRTERRVALPHPRDENR